MLNKPIIVISGANITLGGPLQIFREFLSIINLNGQYRVIAIVGDKKLFSEKLDVEFIEIKKYRRFVFLKFFYEYVYYYFFSKKMDVELWLSLNDCSPFVKAKVQAVYCHNAAPFYKRTLYDYLHPTRIFLQSFYYHVFYRININRNKFVIVQQDWMRKYLINTFHVKYTSVIVNHIESKEVNKKSNLDANEFIFIYPTKAQPYKNVEVILNAFKNINSTKYPKFRVILTIDGKENSYSKMLFKKYGHIESINWLGNISREELEKLYEISNCLIFSSTLETWGLPITEFKSYNKPMLLADFPYSHESIGIYNKVKFFEHNNSDQLRDYVLTLIQNKNLEFDKNFTYKVNQPYVKGINALFKVLIK
jgi:hypothetical protein